MPFAPSTSLARFAQFRAQMPQVPARRSGPSPAVSALRGKLEALQNRSKALRANAGGKGGNVEAVIATIAGGAVAGAVKAKFPTVMGFDTNIGVAALAIGAGLFLVKGRMGGWLLNLGGGVGAVVVSDLVEDMLDGDAGDAPAEVEAAA